MVGSQKGMNQMISRIEICVGRNGNIWAWAHGWHKFWCDTGQQGGLRGSDLKEVVKAWGKQLDGSYCAPPPLSKKISVKRLFGCPNSAFEEPGLVRLRLAAERARLDEECGI
jgi:hypothetical protein